MTKRLDVALIIGIDDYQDNQGTSSSPRRRAIPWPLIHVLTRIRSYWRSREYANPTNSQR
jgi:hypothetical protein